MRKFRSVTILTSVIAATVGCSTAPSNQAAVEQLRTDPASISFDWQKPYEAIIRDFKSSDKCSADSAFDLFDIDGDHVPELIVSPSTDPKASCLVYTCRDGKSVELGEVGKGGVVVWLPEFSLYRGEYQGDNFTIGSCSKFDGDGFVEEINYYSSISSVKHTINGEKYLLPDYEEAMKPYNEAYSVTFGRKFGFGENAVRAGLYCSESWGAVINAAERDVYRGKLNEFLEGNETSGDDTAFELFDVNGDDIPELVISQGSSEESKCLIYYISEGRTCVTEPFGYAGTVRYDFGQNVMFCKVGDNKYACASLSESAAGADVSVEKLDDWAEFGRKYPLTAENIQLALN